MTKVQIHCPKSHKLQYFIGLSFSLIAARIRHSIVIIHLYNATFISIQCHIDFQDLVLMLGDSEHWIKSPLAPPKNPHWA